MTFGSLFAGIGGIDLGLERAGMECRWQVEIDPFCNKVLAKHWPEVKRYADITRLTGHELEPVDLLCGGFPCQDLSQAGKRAGIEGSRSGLWFEFARIIGVLRPRYVLVENVPGLLNNDAMRRVVGELDGLGYVGFWRCLRAADFGASHLRKRVFILAYRTDNRHVFGPRSNSIRENVLSTQSGIRAGQQDRTGESERCRGNVAYSESRRFGELRQPSGTEGFPNRYDANLADTECLDDERWRDAGILGIPPAEKSNQKLQRQRAGNAADDCSNHVADSQYEGCGILGTTHDANRNHASGHDADGCGAGILDNSAEPQCWREFEPGRTRKRRPGSERADGTLADAEFARLEIGNRKREQQLRQNSESLAPGLLPGVADAGNRFLPQPRSGSEGRNGPGSAGKSFSGNESLEDTEQGRLVTYPRTTIALSRPTTSSDHSSEILPTFAPGPNDPRWPAILAARPDLAPALESAVRKLADGVSTDLDGAMSNRTKRLGRLGNAVVPQVAEWIGRRILEIENGTY